MIEHLSLPLMSLVVFGLTASSLSSQEIANVVAPVEPADVELIYKGEKKLRGLLITGGCCHNYLFQGLAITSGIEAYGNIEWEVVRDGGTGTSAEIELYDDPNWAKGFDVVVHNECFARTTNPEYIRRITEVHRSGVPSVVIHCAMHTYRDAEIDDWRQFLGVTSKRHDHNSEYAVRVTKPAHPAMKGFPANWVTPKDELYIVEKLWPTATTLATSVSEKDGKEHSVIWVNEFGATKDKPGVRVFGTTYGHSDDTFRDPVFIRLLASGVFWAAGVLEEAPAGAKAP